MIRRATRMVELSVRSAVRAPLTGEGLPAAVALVRGTRERLFLTLTNAAPILDEVVVQVDGLLPGWRTLSATRMRLLPYQGADLTLELHPPGETPPLAGRYPATLRVASRGTAGVGGAAVPFE